MGRSQTNIVIDTVAFIAIVFLAATGAVMKYVLPPGSGHFSTLWGIDRHEWGEVHYWIACTLLAAVSLHIFMHWGWVVAVVQGRLPERARLRTTLAIVILAMIVAVALSPFAARVEESGEPPHKQQSGTVPRQPTGEPLESPSIVIDGTMTLQDVEQRTGVPAAFIAKELGLPVDVPTDERLGKLRKTHDFHVHDIQQIVQKYPLNQAPPQDARP